MNEFHIDAALLVCGLLAFIMGLLAWLGSKHVEKLEELDKTAVRKQDLKETLDLIRSERQRMHDENQDQFRDIKGDLKAISKSREGFENEIRRALYHRGDR